MALRVGGRRRMTRDRGTLLMASIRAGASESRPIVHAAVRQPGALGGSQVLGRSERGALHLAYRS
jgi:hypothetical protein